MLGTATALITAMGMAAAWAQVTPGLINFQGRLTDSSNNPLSGSHDFIFSLHGTATGGIPVWTESQSGVSVSNGVFAVQLGAASPLTHDLFTATTLYLQISVDGVMLSPRERLAGVAYAFNTDRLQGFTPAYFVSTAAVSQTIAGAKTFTGSLTVPAPTVFSGQGFDPAGTPGAIYYNSVTSKLRLYNGSGFVDIATGTISGIANIQSESAQFTGDGAGLPLTLKSSSVTLQGNIFNIADKLVKLDATGKLPALDGSQLTAVSASQIAASGVQAGSLGAGVIASSIAAGAITSDAQIASGAGIAQSKIANLTTDLGARLLKAGDSMSGDLQVGGATASTYSTGGYLTMANLSSPPSGARGRLYFDSTGSGALRISLDGASFVPISTGSSGGSGGLSEVASDASQFSGQGISGSALTLKSSSVTLQGNVFNAANKLVQLDATGRLPAVDGSQLTGLASSDATKVAKAGDTMTGDLQVGAANASTVSASGFMTLANLGAAPTAATGRLYFDSASKKLRLSTGTSSSAWVDLSTGGASGLSSISADSGQFSGDGSSPATQLTLLSSSVTLQGNSFNAANKLVRLDGTGKLPAVDGSLLTGITASDSTKLAKAGDTMAGDLQVGAANASTVSASGFITLANLGAQPGAARGRLYFDPTGSGSLRLSLDGTSFVPISTGAAGAGISSVQTTVAEITGDGAGVPLKLNSSSVTMVGNAFNAANKLVQLDGTGKLPAIDGSQLTGITVSGGVLKTGDSMTGPLTLYASTLTVRGDAFSVGGSTLSVLYGNVGAGTSAPASRLHVSGGDLQVGDASASTLSASGFLGLAGLAAAPGAAAGRLYYDASLRTLRLSTGTSASSWVDLSTGASGSGGSGGPHAASHAPGGGDAIDGSYLSLANAQTLTGAKTFDGNLILGAGQIASSAGQLGVTVSTSLFVSGPVRIGGLGSDPAATYAGQVYYNSVTNLLRFNMNGTWVNLSTASAGGAGGAGFWGDASPHIYNTNPGNMGLGTASPGEKLDINGAMVLRGMGSPTVASGGQAKMYFDSSSNKLRVSENGGGFTNLIGGAGGAVTLQGATPGLVDTGNLNLSGTGVFGSSVAVGTQSPLSRLHVVNGDIRISTTTGTRGIIFQDGTVQTTASGNSVWSVSGQDIGNNTSGNVGVGTTSPAAKLHVTGSGGVILNAGNVGIGTTNPAGKLEVAGAGNVLFNTTGNVGVGTAAPGSTLTVAGLIESKGGGFKFPDGSIQSAAAGNTLWTASGQNLYNSNTANVGVGTTLPTARLTISSVGATSSDVLLAITTGAASGSEVFSVKGDAKVGIGVGSPAYPLHIVSNLPVRTTLMVDNNSSGANTSVALRFAKNASDRWNIFTDVLQNGSNDLSFLDAVAGAHRFYISNGGSIGMGTTSPQSKLDIAGSAAVGSTYAGSSAAPADGLIVEGNVGIGTSNPASAFNVVGVSSMSASSANPALLVAQSGAGPSAVFLGGKVGVGVAAPAEAVDLNGAMAFRGMSVPAVAPAGQGKLYFDSTTKKLKLSEDGGVFINLIGGAGGAVTLQGSTPGSADSGHLNVTGTALVGGNLGVGTAAPGDKLDVAGNIRMSAGGVLTTAGVAPLRINVDDAVGGSSITFTRGSAISMIIDSAGNVGISTSPAGEKLDLNGAMVFRGMASPAIASDGQGKIYFDSTANKIKISESGGAFVNLIGGAGGAVTLQGATPGVSDSGHLNLTGNALFGGNIGLGAAAPGQKLDIRSGGVAVSYDGTAGKSLFVDPATGKVGLGTAVPQNRLDVGGATAVGASYAGVSAAPANGLIIEGSVGVGTSNPATTLEVNGSLSVGSGVTKATFTAAGDLNIPGAIVPSVDGSKDLGSSVSRWNKVWTNQVVVVTGIDMAGSQLSNSGSVVPQTTLVSNLGSDAKRWSTVFSNNLYAAGNVGVGTSSPGGPLHVTGAGNMLLAASGNAGIGTTAPTHRLDVSGDAIVRSSLTVTAAGLSGTQTVFQAAGATLTVRYDGMVGIGTSVPSSTLTVVGLIESKGGGIKFPDGSIQTAAAGANQWAASGSDINNTNSGNIGVGTGSPGAKLHVADASGAGVILNAGNVGIGSNSLAARLSVSTASAQAADNILAVSTASASASEALVVKGDAKVGVGLGTPLFPLHVAAAGGPSSIMIDNRFSGANSASFLRLAKNGSDRWDIMTDVSQNGTNDFSIYDAVTGGVAGHRLYIKSTGEIGIGTTSPGAGALNVVGVSSMSLSGAGAALQVHQNGAGPSAWFLGGSVGVGTTAPASKLTVMDGDIRISTSAGSRGIVFQDGSIQTSAAGASFWASNGIHSHKTNAGGVGIGATAPAYMLHLASETPRAFIQGTQNGSNAAWILQAKASDGTARNGGYYLEPGTTDDNTYLGLSADGAGYQLALTRTGNTGLGTTAPGERLDVNGAMVLRGMATPALSSAGQGKLYFNSATNKLQISEDGAAFVNLIGGAGGAVTLQGSTPGIPDTGHINITGTGVFGTLGLGISNPAYKLDLRSGGLAVSSNSAVGKSLFVNSTNAQVGLGTTAPATRLHLFDAQTAGSVTARVENGGGNTAELSLKVNTGGASTQEWSLRGQGASNGAPGDFAVVDVTAGLERLHIQDATGNTGVGTSAPASTLDVAGDSTLRGYARVTGTATVEGNAFSVGASTLAVSGGNVGIGTASPAGRLHVEGSGNMLLNASGNLGVGTTNPATRLHVAGSASVVGGDMGVGTASPLSKLHVVDGDIRISTTSGSRGIIFQDGSVMTTAASGSGSSQFTRVGGLLYPNTLTDRLNIGRSDLGSAMLAVATNTTAAPAVFVDASEGKTGLGTASPGERLDIDGALILRGMATPAVAAGGQGKMYFDSSSNKLKISESGGSFTNLIGGAGGAVTLQGSTPGVPDTGNLNLTGTGLFAKIGMGTNAPGQKLDIRSGGMAVSHDASAGSALFVNSSNGRVGLGTTSPSDKLQVLGGDVLIGAPSVHDTTSNPDLVVQGNVVVNGRIVQDGGGQSSFANLGVSTATNTGELFKVGAGTITALTSGKVGLGTLTPSVLLHIKSPSASDSQLWIDRDSASTQKAVLSFRKQGAARWSVGTDLSDAGNNDFFIQDEVAGAVRLFVNSSGQMGIGTTSPSAGSKLDIAGAGNVMIRSASQFEIDTSNSGYVSFKSNGLEVMRLKP